MAINALPTPPSRSDSATFADRADAFHAALPAFAVEANALQVDVNAKSKQLLHQAPQPPKPTASFVPPRKPP